MQIYKAIEMVEHFITIHIILTIQKFITLRYSNVYEGIIELFEIRH